jgi:hypothetical protein
VDARCDQGVAEQGVVSGEEGDGMVVGLHQVVGMVGVAGEHLADEAWSLAGASLVGCGVDGPPR